MKQSIFDIEDNIQKMFPDDVFTELQLLQIQEGLAKGLDVSVYADPKYNAGQMNIIRSAMLQNVDYTYLLDTRYDIWQQIEILSGLVKGQDVSKFANPNISSAKMMKIRSELEEHK